MEYDPAEADLSLASLFAGWALADELQRRLAADGLTDLRFADGLLFQHLVGGPQTIGALRIPLAEVKSIVRSIASRPTTVKSWPRCAIESGPPRNTRCGCSSACWVTKPIAFPALLSELRRQMQAQA